MPDDGVVDRFAAVFFPDDGRFALVGDADGGDFFRANAGGFQHFAGDAALGSPDFHRIVLDPARFRVDLGEFLLCNADTLAGLVEEDGAGAGGALVEGEDVLFAHGGRPVICC